ncbi:Sugar (pentulose or hexulose) kinase [Paracoccus halophilus]|uniref:Carbohydrate kinase n=1 Tax=Paracoccus halophilus TaxID=376733 RepID=A0A099EXL2_9RHOB|nr:FGGY-family carbohydrate kinase [Paracoccus halophilus]KGJ02731.1 carbohydrate kinase [Paracoccus halophilus]SFA60423.1 Sugar (pentulose or hexulose) kinase [Paracoccus halophilus]
MTRIAVIDIGKTNAKLALVEGETLAEIAVVTRPNRPLPGPPWSHVDLDGHWDFFLHHLSAFHAAHGVDAISVTTHGAAAVLLDDAGQVAVPMLDYEHPGPGDLAAEYDALRPDFAQTGSPRLPGGLNLGAQLHWLLHSQPDLAARIAHVVTYPQYWGWRLTGEMASDVSSLGCHTDLWDPWQGRFSELADRLELAGKLAPARRANEVLGHLRPDLAAGTGLRPGTPVAVGIHDSNASLYPYVLGRQRAFSVVSTGTWVIAMAMGGDRMPLDPARDVLVNVNALGQPVPSARFMGGREFELVRNGSDARPTDADRAAVLSRGLMLLPAVEPGSGPFQGRAMRWTGDAADEAARMVALSWYLALMTDTCLRLIGARGPAIIEGPFGRNPDYCTMLATLRPEGVQIAASATGTSAGAALLCMDNGAAPDTRPVTPDPALAGYAADWAAVVEGG